MGWFRLWGCDGCAFAGPIRLCRHSLLVDRPAPDPAVSLPAADETETETGHVTMMLTFFHGWRRMLGAATLVLACVLMAGWVRSGLLEDRLYLNLTGKSINRFISSPSGLAWEMMGYPFQILRPETIDQPGPRWNSRAINRFGPFYAVDVIRDWKWFGFRYRAGRTNAGDFPSLLVIIPYWSIVLPLTLLSCSLILSKPRPRKPPTPAQSPSRNRGVHHL